MAIAAAEIAANLFSCSLVEFRYGAERLQTDPAFIDDESGRAVRMNYFFI
jgi:hypothetical protein